MTTSYKNPAPTLARWLLSLAAIAALLPAYAGAATYSYGNGGGDLLPGSQYIAADGEANNLVVTTSVDASGVKQVVLDDVVDVTPGPAHQYEDRNDNFLTYECTRPDPGDMTRLSCPIPSAQDSYGRILSTDAPLRITLGDRNDRLSYRNAIANFKHLRIYGDDQTGYEFRPPDRQRHAQRGRREHHRLHHQCGPGQRRHLGERGRDRRQIFRGTRR